MKNKIFPKAKRKKQQQYGRKSYKNISEDERRNWFNIEKNLIE